MNCPDYCDAYRDFRPYCRLRNGCKAGHLDTCPLVHTTPSVNGWQFTESIELGALIKRNGVVEYRVRCTGCGTESSGIGNNNFRLLLARGLEFTWFRQENNDSQLRCSHKTCTRDGIEWHHIAPRNTFPDADDWPILPLCRFHHQHWHQMMDGYRWNTKTLYLTEDAV